MTPTTAPSSSTVPSASSCRSCTVRRACSSTTTSGKTHSSGKLLYSGPHHPVPRLLAGLRVRPEGRAVSPRIDRRRKLPVSILLKCARADSNEEMLAEVLRRSIHLRTSTPMKVCSSNWWPERLRGEDALNFDLARIGEGKVIVQKPASASPRKPHSSELEASKHRRSSGRAGRLHRSAASCRTNVVDANTGEAAGPGQRRNHRRSVLREAFRKAEASMPSSTLWVNDLDQWPVPVSTTLRIDPTNDRQHGSPVSRSTA